MQCNNWIKFGKLFDYADSVGAEFVATGHYARLRADALGDPGLAARRGRCEGPVLRAVWHRAGVSLPRMLLPVGDYQKPQIRELATGLGFNVAEKKDSQEICFVTQGRYDRIRPRPPRSAGYLRRIRHHRRHGGRHARRD